MKNSMTVVMALILSISSCISVITTEAKELEKEDELKQLQVPQKLGIVIDPWEMDGNGQIYSEQYVIRNNGKNPGILTLSNLACIPQEDDVIVRTNPTGMHDDEEKSVYMQMKFGNGDQMVLAQESSEYQVALQSQEELSICFQGEVNEYAKDGWKDSDIAVRVVYSWNVIDTEDGIVEEETLPDDESSTVDEEAEKSNDLLKENELPEIVELQDQTKTRFTIDSWQIDENGKICTGWYTIRNVGENVGTFTLSDILCKLSKESGIVIRTEFVLGEEIAGEDLGEFLGNELTEENPGESEKQEKPEESVKSEYKVELGAGEEFVFHFIGELNGINPEELKDGDIEVSAIYSWTLEERIAE